MGAEQGAGSKPKSDDKASRRVSNMTAWQVEKKRAIDRVNQRHCRDKQRARLENLEKQVAELSQKLAEANEKLSRYESQLPVTPPCSSAVLTSPGRKDAQNQAISLLKSLSTLPDDHITEAASSFMLDSRLQTLPPDFDLGMALDMMDHDEEFRFVDIGLDDELHPLTSEDVIQPSIADQDTDNLSRRGTSNEGKQDDGDWSQIPPHTEPMCELDRLVHGVLAASQPLTEHGNELNEATFPSISSLLNPSVEADKSRPLSKLVAAQVWKSSVQGVTERIAYLYVLAQLLRWYLRRDKQSYDHVPDFMKPTRLQRTVRHPAWIDLVMWPAVRDLVIQHMDWNDFPSFRKLTGGTLSVRWPHTDSGAILESADGQHLTLNPIFKAHIRNEKNWTVGPEVQKKYPWLQPFCRSGSEY